jgi:hypothetical protein
MQVFFLSLGAIVIVAICIYVVAKKDRKRAKEKGDRWFPDSSL